MTTNPIFKLFDLSGKTAVLTGAGSGMGRSTAQLLSAAGAKLVLGDINEESLDETVRMVEDTGGTASSLRVDVARKTEVDALAQKAVDDFGRIDIMGNIAGIPHQSMVVDTTEEDLDRVLAVNLKGVFFGCQAAARVMQEQGSGSIVNISSSIIYTSAGDTYSAYGMAKAGVAMLTKTLAKEIGPYGVRVNTIAPGQILTNFSRRHFSDAEGNVIEDRLEAFKRDSASRGPLGLLGKPEYVAHTFLYLVSDAAEFVTGQIIGPNGGTSMPW